MSGLSLASCLHGMLSKAAQPSGGTEQGADIHSHHSGHQQAFVCKPWHGSSWSLGTTAL